MHTVGTSRISHGLGHYALPSYIGYSRPRSTPPTIEEPCYGAANSLRRTRMSDSTFNTGPCSLISTNAIHGLIFGFSMLSPETLLGLWFTKTGVVADGLATTPRSSEKPAMARFNDLFRTGERRILTEALVVGLGHDDWRAGCGWSAESERFAAWISRCRG